MHRIKIAVSGLAAAAAVTMAGPLAGVADAAPAGKATVEATCSGNGVRIHTQPTVGSTTVGLCYAGHNLIGVAPVNGTGDWVPCPGGYSSNVWNHVHDTTNGAIGWMSSCYMAFD